MNDGIFLRLQRWAATAALTLLCIAIVFSPLPFGSVGLPAIVVWVGVLGLSAILVAFQPLRSRQTKLLLPLWVFCGCWAAVCYLQISPSDGMFSRLANPIWAQTGDILGQQLQAIPAALRSQTVTSQGPALLAVLALGCGIVLGSAERGAKAIVIAFAWSGLAYAIFGIVSFLVDPTTVFGFEKDAYRSELTATFYNRNTAAFYFGSCAIVWLMFGLEKIKTRNASRDPDKPEETARPFLWGVLSIEMLPKLLAVFVCLVATFMTRSRAGAVVSVTGLGVASLAFFFHSLPSRSSWLVAMLGAISGSGLLIQFLGGGTAERISVDGLSDGGRFEAYKSTLKMIADAPWLGSGLGSFPWVFPIYRSPAVSSWGVWDRAHNTLLELTAEVGLPLSALFVMGWLAMFVMLLRGIATRRKGVGWPAGALGILVAATLHSMVDFPMQIPAVSIVVFAVIGAGLSQSFRPHSLRPQSLQPRSASRQVSATVPSKSPVL